MPLFIGIGNVEMAGNSYSSQNLTYKKENAQFSVSDS